MRALVTYGSKMGGTRGLAEMAARALEDRGVDVEVCPARDVTTVAGYDTVIVGGALYSGRWHRDARRLLRRQRRALRAMPVWLFSSGPLDSSASRTVIPPTRQVRRLMEKVGALGHATFGGRLSEEPRGTLARAMAKTFAGDWRDPWDVERWIIRVVGALHSLGHGAPAPPPEAGKPAHDNELPTPGVD